MINFKKCSFILAVFLTIVFCACVKVPEHCDGYEFDQQNQFCFKNEIYEKCPGGRYDPESEFCSENDNKVYEKCGGDIYNTATHRCGDDGKSIPYVEPLTVTFDTDGGIPATIEPVTVYYGSSLGGNFPANPKKDGHVFAGWFDKETKTKQYTASDKITDHLDLTAKWVAGSGLSEFTDTRDEKKYRTVLMPDGKVWMAENLNFFIHADSSWSPNSGYRDTYGLLYNWAAASRACPEGWHLPSEQEWRDLVCAATIDGGGSATGNCTNTGSTAATRLKSQTGWNNRPNGSSANGTDNYEFSALPGGSHNGFSAFNYLGEHGYWWSVTESGTNAHYRIINASTNTSTHVGGGSISKTNRFSVRCIKN